MTRERRKGERMKLHSLVEAAGIDTSSAQFFERARIEDVSDAGCRFSLQHSVQSGTFIALKPLGEHGESLPDEHWRLFVAMWVKGDGERFAAGVRSVLREELAGSPVPASRGTTRRH
jgi:hypothetical protein